MQPKGSVYMEDVWVKLREEREGVPTGRPDGRDEVKVDVDAAQCPSRF